ncbi:MAG: CoA transferase subunit A [Deltaproteobacteria bacterium]|nr:CoA transferase subunit A [Deltaproteobacteria bacterium]
MGASKIIPLDEAIRQLTTDGMSLALGTALEGMIPFAAGHEIIRQGKKDLTLIGPISDILFDQLIGAGSVARVIAAWVGNVTSGAGYNFRRAVEQGHPRSIEVLDHSNYSLALALAAGAAGTEFAVTRSLFGSDISLNQDIFRELICPFTGERHLAVRALRPDLTILHVQRCDSRGNAHFWGSSGVSLDAAAAADRVLLTTEEIVPTEFIRSDPSRTLIPEFLVSAVALVPWGAHPSSVYGFYGHDDDYYIEYAQATKDRTAAHAWYQEWVFGLPDRAAYLQHLDAARLARLRLTHPALTIPVDFGY